MANSNHARRVIFPSTTNRLQVFAKKKKMTFHFWELERNRVKRHVHFLGFLRNSAATLVKLQKKSLDSTLISWKRKEKGICTTRARLKLLLKKKLNRYDRSVIYREKIFLLQFFWFPIDRLMRLIKNEKEISWFSCPTGAEEEREALWHFMIRRRADRVGSA